MKNKERNDKILEYLKENTDGIEVIAYYEGMPYQVV